MTRVHATSVAIDGRGILIAGPSGSGKSDLALRLIDRGAMLVSDDYTELATEGTVLIATAPATIAGKLEIRGLGIVPFPTLAQAPIALYIAAGTPARMPAPTYWTMLDVTIPQLTLSLLEPSVPLKVEHALRVLP